MTPLEKAIERVEKKEKYLTKQEERCGNSWSSTSRIELSTVEEILDILKEEAKKEVASPCKKFLVIKPCADAKGGIDKIGLFFAKHHCDAFLAAQKAFDDDMRAMASYPVDDLPDGWIFKI